MAPPRILTVRMMGRARRISYMPCAGASALHHLAVAQSALANTIRNSEYGCLQDELTPSFATTVDQRLQNLKFETFEQCADIFLLHTNIYCAMKINPKLDSNDQLTHTVTPVNFVKFLALSNEAQAFLLIQMYVLFSYCTSVSDFCCEIIHFDLLCAMMRHDVP